MHFSVVVCALVGARNCVTARWDLTCISVNRCQKEIQKTVGKPAQDERIQSFLQDFASHLSRLDQRLDALQTVLALLTDKNALIKPVT